MRSRALRQRTRGSVLIVVVGMLAILLLMTISVGRRANQELVLVKYSLQKMQSRYLAWAGFHYSLSYIRADGLDEKTGRFDNQFACGVKLIEEQTPEDIFKEVKLGGGSFGVTAGQDPVRYGMGDEDGKLNLNAVGVPNYGILKELLMIAGLDLNSANMVAASAVDWRDEDSEPALGKEQQQEEGPFGPEKEPFRAKNRPFDQVVELMFINRMTPEVYEKIKNGLTVFPRRADNLKINLATAPREVLLAMARFFSGPVTGTSRGDADGLVTKLFAFRAGEDRIEGTEDDQDLVETKMALTMPEQVIFRLMMQYETKTSRFISFRVSGFEGANRRQSHIDAVVDRETLTVVSWRND